MLLTQLTHCQSACWRDVKLLPIRSMVSGDLPSSRWGDVGAADGAVHSQVLTLRRWGVEMGMDLTSRVATEPLETARGPLFILKHVTDFTGKFL